VKDNVTGETGFVKNRYFSGEYNLWAKCFRVKAPATIIYHCSINDEMSSLAPTFSFISQISRKLV
jgi:hypothetical protein